MDSRLKKQIFIGLIFLIFIFLLGLFFYFIFGFYKSSPQKQSIIFQNPEVIWVKLFKLNPTLYDFGARIKNTNLNYGSPFLNYTFSAYDKDGNLIKTISDKTYILSNEEKYLIKNRVEVMQMPVKIILSFEKIDWQTIPQDQKIKEDFPIFHPTLNILKEENNWAEASGVLNNKTDYDFVSMQISAVLYDFNNEPQAVNKTEINDVYSKEERLVKFNWREPFSENIKTIDMEANTNLFSKDNVF